MGTIPQALFLMNGPMVNNRIQARPGTVLGEISERGPEPPRGLERPVHAGAVAAAHERGSGNLQPLYDGGRKSRLRRLKTSTGA